MHQCLSPYLIDLAHAMSNRSPQNSSEGYIMHLTFLFISSQAPCISQCQTLSLLSMHEIDMQEAGGTVVCYGTRGPSVPNAKTTE